MPHSSIIIEVQEQGRPDSAFAIPSLLFPLAFRLITQGCGLKCPGWWECSLAAISQTTTHMHGHHEATMGLAVVSLGRELRALALSHTASVRRGTAPENSVSSQNSRAYCALTSQQMLGCIKAINPCLKSTSAMCKAVS